MCEDIHKPLVDIAHGPKTVLGCQEKLRDIPNKSEHVVRVKWECLADVPVCKMFNCHVFCIPGDVRDVESE